MQMNQCEKYPEDPPDCQASGGPGNPGMLARLRGLVGDPTTAAPSFSMRFLPPRKPIQTVAVGGAGLSCPP